MSGYLERIRGAMAVLAGKENPAPKAAPYGHYTLLWDWHQGQWRWDPSVRAQRTQEPVLYDNTRQLWRQSSAIINVYDQFVYQGDLSTDGEPLPDGTRGAIPIDPQTGDQKSNDKLTVAFHELFSMWYWQQQMSVRPRLAAILGDCLTEIVDDYENGGTYPSTIWSGWVTDIELDYVGNVKAYAIEFPVANESGQDKFGKPQPGDQYVYRKEVDGDAFRTYKDGKPFSYDGVAAVLENFYGFTPAVWDRHESVPWSPRGVSALEKTLQQTMEFNSVLSHAMDYQRKQFSAPVGVKGSSIGGRGGRTITLPGGISVNFPSGVDADSITPDDVAAARAAAAENVHLIGMNEHGEFVTVKFDVGQTKEMLGLMMDSIVSESPESRYFHEILTMRDVTGPAMERLLAPVSGLVKAARKMHDPQTVKLLQMNTAIMGERLKRGDIPEEVRARRPARFEAFDGFDLTSFGKGLLDATIPGREIFPETLLEKAQRLVLVQGLTDPYLLEQAGVPKKEIKRMLKEQEDAAAELQASMSVANDQSESPAPLPA